MLFNSVQKKTLEELFKTNDGKISREEAKITTKSLTLETEQVTSTNY